jgi:hypothetical protein
MNSASKNISNIDFSSLQQNPKALVELGVGMAHVTGDNF